jgi:hypothetical protein
MTDAAETLRRAFAGLKVGELAPEPFVLACQGTAILAAAPQAGLKPPVAICTGMQVLREAVAGRALEPFHAQLSAESGWASWGAEAEVVRMTPLGGGQTTRVAVPPLPRKARALGRLEPLDRPPAHRLSETLPQPGVRRLETALGRRQAEAGLEAMLSLAVPIRGEAIQHLPKGVWMRYSLQLVRGTGENVRNLEVLGLFRIPRKGVKDLSHDASLGRILVRLDSSAVRSPRVPFILARRKDDGSLLSCFVEDP